MRIGHLALADPLPGAIGYWKSSSDRETDFVAPAAELGAAKARVPVEVKGDSDSGITAARRSIRQTFHRGVVVTRTRFDWDENIPALPVGVYLAGLADRPERELEL